MSMENTGTSGYTEQLDGEMDAPSIPVDSAFSGLRSFYVSPHGHTQLFYASRYGKSYVLKCLKADYLYTPVYRQALVKEFEIGVQLDHPGICRTIGMEDVPGLGPAIIMERVDGCTLAELIGRKGLTKPLARKIAVQAGSAIDYIHSKQVIHRDLKPSNIMVTYNGHNVKLIDFSLADSDAFEVLKQPAGTSGYIAPELLQPGAKADARSDIYSFGMVLARMARITGDRRLSAVAAECTRRNASERPASVPQMKEPFVPRFRFLFVLFVVVAVLAAVACAVILPLRHRTSIAGQSVDNVEPDGNSAVDCAEWPR